jgi:lysophospholipase L1-like esterase
VSLKDHYPVRLQAISNEVARLKREQHPLCFLGDSLTESNHIKQLGRFHVVNMGIGGDMLEHPDGGLIKRLWLLPLATPSLVLVLIGINDIVWGERSIPEFTELYQKLIESLKKEAGGAPIVLCSLCPVRDHFRSHSRHVAMANVVIEDLAEAHGLPMIDLYGPLCNDEGELRSDLTTDGLHLNEDGYQVVNRVLEAELAKY